MQLPFDLDAEVVRLIKSKSIELPTYPGVALRLQRLIGSGNYGLPDLAKLVESDQALATAVMRAANSAFYGASSPITTLAPAISRVGANSLNNIAIAGTLGVQGNLEGPLASLRKDSWRRSLISALLCQKLAPSRKLDPGEAFLAGLLHDFGETIAYACFEVLLESHPQSRPQNAATWLWEAQRYHLELGMALAAEWKLPDYLLTCVMRHHDAELEGTDYPELVSLVAMCDAVSTRLSETPAIDDVVLGGIPGLRKAELQPLREILLQVPAFLASFDDPHAPSRAVEPSMVAPAPVPTENLGRPVKFSLVVSTRSSKSPYRATHMTAGSLRMTGVFPQAERQLINLEFDGGVKICATVRCCVASDDGCVVDVKPFAMDHKARAAWARLMEPAVSAAA
jgi:HD-like signal output (HDOD) protein